MGPRHLMAWIRGAYDTFCSAQEETLANEIAIMKKVHHENCIAFYESRFPIIIKKNYSGFRFAAAQL